jgi:Protein of unknown function (DUF2934).
MAIKTPSQQSSLRSVPAAKEIPADSRQGKISETAAHEEIARRAHELWEQEGRPEGRDFDHWIEAERQLRGAPAQPESTADARAEARAIKASAERRARGSLH